MSKLKDCRRCDHGWFRDTRKKGRVFVCYVTRMIIDPDLAGCELWSLGGVQGVVKDVAKFVR
jgi:hypothetical protein